jgi:hypothetical protein
MKHAIITIVAFSIILSMSCSKDVKTEQGMNTDLFFFFKMELGKESFFNKGQSSYDYKNHTGPFISQKIRNDTSEIFISTINTIDYPNFDTIFFQTSFVKKGTSISGKYVTQPSKIGSDFKNQKTLAQYVILPDGITFDVQAPEVDAVYGENVGGSYSFDCYKVPDFTTIIPVRGTFRLQVKK